MKKLDKKKVIISVLSAVGVIAVVSLSLYSCVFKPIHYTGTVTDSSTGMPVSDVAVTDGRNVVKTDKDGKYELDGWRKSKFVAITVPSGYETDAFYIKADKSKESYDFKLNKSERTADVNHCFIQISDTEIGENGTGEWLEDIKNTIKENNPAFLIHTGDICYEAGLKKHIEEMNSDTMGCPVLYAIGNHDYVKGRYGEELYESLYGPVWYSFDVGGVHYVVTPFQSGGDYASGYGKNDRWKWLKNDLEQVADDMKVVIFNHTMSPSDDYVISFGRDEIDLKQHNLIAWIFGHYHYNYVYENNGVVNISAPRPDCGGIDSSPASTRVININENGEISTKSHYYDLGKSKNPENTIWNTKLDGNVLFCDTVYDGTSVYTAVVNDDYVNSGAVYRIDANSGEIKWTFSTKNSVKNNICMDENRLVSMDADGNVYCLDKADGKLLWEKKLDLGNALGTSSGICINNGVIFAGASRVVTALDVKNGDAKWSVNRDRGENSPAEFVVTDGKLLVNSHWDALSALDIENGKTLWDNNDEDIRFRSSTPIAVDDKTILVADDNAVMFVNSDDGKMISKTCYDEYSFNTSAQPAYRGNTVYIPTSNEGIVAFDMENKEILWNFKTEENILFTAPYVGKGAKTVESSPVIDGDKLIFGANDGYIYSVNAKTGNLIKKYFAGTAVLGEIAVCDDKIYASSFGGYVMCFEK